MNFLQKLLSENSDVSCMRFMSLISLILGATIAIICVYRSSGAELNAAVPMVSIFVGGAFGGKVAQKLAETKNDKQS